MWAENWLVSSERNTTKNAFTYNVINEESISYTDIGSVLPDQAKCLFGNKNKSKMQRERKKHNNNLLLLFIHDNLFVVRSWIQVWIVRYSQFTMWIVRTASNMSGNGVQCEKTCFAPIFVRWEQTKERKTIIMPSKKIKFMNKTTLKTPIANARKCAHLIGHFAFGGSMDGEFDSRFASLSHMHTDVHANQTLIHNTFCIIIYIFVNFTLYYYDYERWFGFQILWFLFSYPLYCSISLRSKVRRVKLLGKFVLRDYLCYV